MKKSFERDGVLMLALLFVAVLGGWELFRLLNGLLGGSYGTRPCLFRLLSCWCGLRCSPGKSGGQRHGRWTAFLWPASA